MQRKKMNLKSIVITSLLIGLLFVVFYSFVGILISGPIYKNEADIASVMNKIKVENKNIESVERNVFTYVTYTGEEAMRYIIFDEKGSRIAIRDKDEKQVKKVKEMIKKSYPNLIDSPIKVGYGKNNPVYLIEKEYELLVINYDTLKVEFYMKEDI